MEKDLLVLELETGEKKEFYKLAEFRSVNTHKDYVMFTDKDKEINADNIYFNIVTVKNGEIVFEKIETEEDNNECKKALDELIERLTKKE